MDYINASKESNWIECSEGNDAVRSVMLRLRQKPQSNHQRSHQVSRRLSCSYSDIDLEQ
jgi:hypothetical protein